MTYVPPPGRKYLTEQEMAERYRVSTRTLFNWRLKGIGPKSVKIGRIVRYPEEESHPAT